MLAFCFLVHAIVIGSCLFIYDWNVDDLLGVYLISIILFPPFLHLFFIAYHLFKIRSRGWKVGWAIFFVMDIRLAGFGLRVPQKADCEVLPDFDPGSSDVTNLLKFVRGWSIFGYQKIE